MNVLKTARVALATCVLVAAGSSMASAEIVYLTSGRTLSVKAHAESGESVVLTLRGGGDVTLDKTLVEKIVPDEVPHPEPAPPAPAQEQPPQEVAETAAPQRTSLLRQTSYSDLI